MIRRKCDHCQTEVSFAEDDLNYREAYDEYWCWPCVDNENERAAERQQESMDSIQTQYERAWEQKRRLR